MTRIDFYILDDKSTQARELFACKLIEKIHLQGHSIFVLSQNAQHAAVFDDLLWTYKPESFVPHALFDAEMNNNCSVILGLSQGQLANTNKHDVIINFDTHIPETFSQYNRVVEIVNKKDNSSNDGRTRYKYYKDRGYKMESHNIRG